MSSIDEQEEGAQDEDPESEGDEDTVGVRQQR